MQRIRCALFAWLGLAGLIGALLGPATASADTFTSWTAGPDAALDNTYDGFIDTPTMNGTVPTGSFTVAGWFVDRTAQGWAGADDVQVWQGTMDGGGKMLAKALFAQSRPDVASALGNPYWAASGFSAFVGANAVSAGPQTLSVYAHTPGKGWWYKQINANASTSAPTAAAPAAPGPAAAAPAGFVSGGALPIVAIEKPGSGDTIKTKPDVFTLMGYALDTNAAPNQGVQGTGIDRVSVYVDKERDNGGTFLGDADLAFSDQVPATTYGPQFASAGWRLDFKPTNLHAGSHTLFVYAHSAVTNKEDLATVGFTTSESP
jgi:hypothetical protein